MAAPRKQDNIRESIINTCEQLLKEKSFSEISLGEISQICGISKGTLYYHFNNKDDLLFAIMDRYLDQQWQDFLNWTNDESKDTSLHRLIKYVLERDIKTAPMRFHFFFEAISGNEIIREKLLERYTKFAQLIASKISLKSNLDPDYLAWMLLILSDGMMMHDMMKNPMVNTDQFIEMTENYLKKLPIQKKES